MFRATKTKSWLLRSNLLLMEDCLIVSSFKQFSVLPAKAAQWCRGRYGATTLHPDSWAVPILVLALTVGIASCAGQSKVVQTGPEDITKLKAAIAATSQTRQVPVGFILPPQEERDPRAPLTALQGLIADIESLDLKRNGTTQLPPQQAHVAAAARYLRRAYAAYSAPEPRHDRVFETIGAALREVDHIRVSQGKLYTSELVEVVKRLADAARRIAADTTQVAMAAKASVAGIAQAHLTRGDDAVAQGLFGPAIGSYADAFVAAGAGIVLDLGLLETNIRGALDGETVGYAYAIARDGILHTSSEGIGGLARRSVDPMERPQSPAKEMYTASISKTISATALLKALQDAGISVDETIGIYLPADWDQGDDLDLVTFRHLLTHTSGLDPADTAGGGSVPQTDTSLQTIVALGSDDRQRGNHNYRNANYSLLRVLIPRVVYGALVDVLAATMGAEAVHAGLYEHYVSQSVLAPAGISQNQCQPAESSTTRTLLYPFPPGDTNGIDAGDWSLSCGATGWFLSVLDLGTFLAHLRFTSDILAPGTRALMDNGFLGWLDPVAYATWVQGTWGIYRAHAGDFTNMTGCVMNFPSAPHPDFPGVKVQVTLLINSTGGTLGTNLPIIGPRKICKILKTAYDEAWVARGVR